MGTQLIQIAKRLKSVREENELSLEWAAASFELTPRELQAYESGEEEIPVSFLYMAAKKYGIELSVLLTGVEPQEQLFSLTRKDAGVTVERRKEYGYQSLCADFAHKKIEPLIVTVPLNKDQGKAHFNSHPGQEFHYVLKGHLKVIFEQKELILEPGDSLMFHCEHRHALEAVGDEPAQVLVIII